MSLEPQMHSDVPNEYVRPSSAGKTFLFLLTLAIIVAVVPWLTMRRNRPFIATPGADAPPIVAQGWLNGEAPTPESLAGKVVLIDVWASWCQPCRRATPMLVKLHEQYASRGVVFIGLTTEEKSSLTRIRDFVQGARVKWLIGWGANETVLALGTEFLPTIYVIGADGKLLWNTSQDGTIEAALEQALVLADAHHDKKG